MLKALFPLAVVTTILGVNSNGSDIQKSIEQGDFAAAREQVDLALQDTPDNPALLLMKVRVELAENNLDLASTTINNVMAKNAKNPDAQALAGKLFGLKASRASIFKAGRFAKKSLTAYETALKLQPDNQEALIGMIQYRLSAPRIYGGDPNIALSYAQQLKDIDPITGSLELARIHEAKNNDEQQMVTLQELTTSNPEDPRAWVQLGFIHQAKRDYPKAHSAFDSAIDAAMTHGSHHESAQAARYQLGRTAVFAKTNAEEGIAALSDYVSLPIPIESPEKAWALYRRGLLYEFNGQKDQAQRDFDEARNTEDKNLLRLLKGR